MKLSDKQVQEGVAYADKLLALMEAPIADAPEVLRNHFPEIARSMANQVESRFSDIRALDTQLWSVEHVDSRGKTMQEHSHDPSSSDYSEKYPIPENFYDKNKGIVQELDKIIETNNTELIQANQSWMIPSGGSNEPATNACFELVIDPSAGFLGASCSQSPLSIRQTDLPALKKWSDIAYLCWKKVVKDGGQAPSMIARLKITNKDTEDIIDYACLTYEGPSSGLVNPVDKPTSPPVWPGFLYSMQSTQAKLLLQSPNGKGVAWSLIQHKEAFGVKTIDKVRLFKSGSENSYSIVFYVVGAENKANIDVQSKKNLE